MKPTSTSKPVPSVIALAGSSFTVGAWDGVSKIVAEFPLTGITTPFTIINQPLPLENFVLAIRWLDSSGNFSARYRFYEQGSEVLYYPVFDFQAIQPTAVFEIWSTEDSPVGITTIPTINFTVSIYTESGDSLSSCCCAVPQQVTYTLYMRAGTVAADDPCNPFCVSMCYP